MPNGVKFHIQQINFAIDEIKHRHGAQFERETLAQIKSRLATLANHPVIKALELLEEWKNSGK